jgi:hypothetical protein
MEPNLWVSKLLNTDARPRKRKAVIITPLQNACHDTFEDLCKESMIVLHFLDISWQQT